MSKFDAKRLATQQLLDCAQAYLDNHQPLDGHCSSALTQSRLDAARVPETAAELEKEFINALIVRLGRAKVWVVRAESKSLLAIKAAREREAGE